MKDFAPVALVAFLPNVRLVDPNLGVNNVVELIALLKKDEKKRTFASSGAGTSTHLAGEMFADLMGVPLAHIPYKGTPPAIVDVSSGQVTFMFDQMTAALPLLQAGKLKRLAVTTAKRIALAPATPTMIEAGVPGFEMSSWQAIYAPKGTPQAIVQRLYAEIAKALKQPDVQAKLGGQLGMEIVGGSPEQLAALMAREIPRWAALVKKSGATANRSTRRLACRRLRRAALARACFQCVAQQVFHLRVRAAQLCCGETLYLGPELRVNAQQERFFVRACHVARARSCAPRRPRGLLRSAA